MDLIINTDGASRGNPGLASYGFIIQSRGGAILHQEGKAIGVATNNIAEYNAVLNALDYIDKRWAKRAPHTLEVITDSQLIASQLSGKFKIKNEKLKLLFGEIKTLEKNLGEVTYRNVPRADNFIADRLANIALDEQEDKLF